MHFRIGDRDKTVALPVEALDQGVNYFRSALSARSGTAHPVVIGLGQVEGDSMELEGLELLSEEECRWLLHQTQVGRVALSVGEVPAVFPVNYMVAGDEILFFSGEGTKLRAAVARTTVTFEVDHMDPFARIGWSVMVVGAAHERNEPAAVAGVERFGLRPWAGGDRFHLIAVAMEFLSGRRIGRVIDLRHRPRLRHDRGVRPHDRGVGPHSRIGGLAQRPVRVGAGSTLQVAADAMRTGGVSAVLAGADQGSSPSAI